MTYISRNLLYPQRRSWAYVRSSIEDVHWIDPSSRDVFSRLVERLQDLRVLLVVTYRPEFAPPWIGRGLVTALVRPPLQRAIAQRFSALALSRHAGDRSACLLISVDRKWPVQGQNDAFDSMYGPAVRCKKISSNWRRRSCINVSGLRLERVVLRAIMDISARAFSLADRPRSGHLGHQCSHALGRPILHSSCPLADLGWKL
jgi:hypothetical protein